MKTEKEILAELKLKEVRVYVWHSKLDEERVGHISVGFDYPHTCYISLWPKTDDSAFILSTPPELIESYEHDVFNEDNAEATHIFRFYTLKNDEMFNRFKAIRNSAPNWALLPGVFNSAHNCATFVLHILKIGGLEDLVKTGRRYILKMQEAVETTRAAVSGSSNLVSAVMTSKETELASMQSLQASFESAEAFASILFESPDCLIRLLRAAEKVEEEMKNLRTKILREETVDITDELQKRKDSLISEISSDTPIVKEGEQLLNFDSPLTMRKGLILLALANKITNLIEPERVLEFNEIMEELEKALYDNTALFLKGELAILDKKFINRHIPNSLLYTPTLVLIENLNTIDNLYQTNIHNLRTKLIENIQNNSLESIYRETIQYEINLLEKRYLAYEFSCVKVEALSCFVKQPPYFRSLFFLYLTYNELLDINATAMKHELESADSFKFYQWSLEYINKAYSENEAKYITDALLKITQHLPDMCAFIEFSLTEFFEAIANQPEFAFFISQKIRPNLTKILQATSCVTIHYELVNNYLIAMQKKIDKAYVSQLEIFHEHLTYQFTRPNRLLNIWNEICKYLRMLEEANQQNFLTENRLSEFEQFYQIHHEILQRNQLTNAVQRMHDFQIQIAKRLDTVVPVVAGSTQRSKELSLNLYKNPLRAIKAIFDRRLLGAEQNNDQVCDSFAIIGEIRNALKAYYLDNIDRTASAEEQKQIDRNVSLNLIKQILSNYQQAADKQLQSHEVNAPSFTMQV